MTESLSLSKPEARPGIPLVDLGAQRERLGVAIDEAIGRVLAHGQFILGPEVRELEDALAQFTGARHAITCASGTDALTLICMAEDIGPGDLVFMPAFTFVATAEAVAQLGAIPCFVDVLPGSFNIDPDSLKAAIASCRESGSGAPRMIIAVDLFGQPADYRLLAEIAGEESLVLVADAAQSFGASLDGTKAGAMADYTATSFFPSKPLGCYGDGGAVFTQDSARAEVVRSLRMHGKGASKYEPVRIGLNSRLDTIQAAILIEKLKIFADELKARQSVATRYNDLLADCCVTPAVPQGVHPSWALYTIRSPRRDVVAATCAGENIATAVYYPISLNRLPPYQYYPVVPGGVPVAEATYGEVLSLPIYPYLDAVDQERITVAVRGACEGER